MIDTRTSLRKFATEGRPLIEQWLDLGDQFKALRDAARNEGVDWASVKSLLKAQIQDERDGTGEGKRVAAIIEKADFASAYADMLGMTGKMTEKNYSRKGVSRETSPPVLASLPAPVSSPPENPVPAAVITPNLLISSPTPDLPTAISFSFDDLGIPPFLRRPAAQVQQ
jgi:hypothetical protein